MIELRIDCSITQTESAKNTNESKFSKRLHCAIHRMTICDRMAIFKRVVARRAVYHTLNVITISLYVRPSVCVKRVLRGGGVGPTLGKMARNDQ